MSAFLGFISIAVDAAWNELPSRAQIVEWVSERAEQVKQAWRKKPDLKKEGTALSAETQRALRAYVQLFREDVRSARQTFQGSEPVQSIFKSVAELSGPLLLHEAAGAGLDVIGLSSLAYLIRLRGRLGFSLRGVVLLALVPPYFSKAEKQKTEAQEEDAVMVDADTRRTQGVQDRAFRDFCNLNLLHVLGMILTARQVSALSVEYLPALGAIGLSLLAKSYVAGHFLWQYPLARDQWTPANVVPRLASRPDAILLLGLASEGVGQGLDAVFPQLIALPSRLLWNLSLVLLVYHFRGPFSVDLKDHPARSKALDPGLLLWHAMNGGMDATAWLSKVISKLISLALRTPAEPPAAVWGRNLGWLLNKTGLRRMDVSDFQAFPDSKGGKLIRLLTGLSVPSGLVTRETVFIFNDYSAAIAEYAGSIDDHRSVIKKSKKVVNSRVFKYVARPFLLWFSGKDGTLAQAIVASDFVLNAFPGITPEKLTEWMRVAADALDNPMVVSRDPARLATAVWEEPTLGVISGGVVDPGADHNPFVKAD